MGIGGDNINNKIMTILGEVTVVMSYKPSSDDVILLKLTEAFNDFALRFIPNDFNSKDPSTVDAVFSIMAEYEGELEDILFKSLTVGGGSAQRLTLSLKNRKIEFQSF